MSELTEDEILKKAQEIERERENKKREEKEQLELEQKKALIGRFFQRGAWHDSDKNLEVYRIYDSPEFGMSLEQWSIHLAGYQHVQATSLEIGRDWRLGYDKDDKELTAEEFYHYVRKILKRTGLYGPLFQESDH